MWGLGKKKTTPPSKKEQGVLVSAPKDYMVPMDRLVCMRENGRWVHRLHDGSELMGRMQKVAAAYLLSRFDGVRIGEGDKIVCTFEIGPFYVKDD